MYPSRLRKCTRHSDLDAQHVTVNRHQLACVSIMPCLVQNPAVVVRHVRGCRLASNHPGQRPPVNTATGQHLKLFRVHESQSGESYLIDTGADISLLPPSDYDREFRTKGPPLRAANNTGITSSDERTKTLNLGTNSLCWSRGCFATYHRSRFPVPPRSPRRRPPTPPHQRRYF